MKLEDLNSKEEIFREFFTWLFDDSRIKNKEIHLEKEIDISLSPYYLDPNIYFPKQINNFFKTRAMQRLGKVSQVSLAIDLHPNLYQNRLEHSKGVYYRKLEEMVYNFQNSEWKEKVEKDNLKLILIAELIKMAGHDIGHFPLSHVMEEQLYNSHGAHEVVGKRIMLEDSEIKHVLNEISPELPNTLKDLYEKNVWNFHEHDESNYDVDRLDYLQRDNIYWGTPMHLPHLNYETVGVQTDETNNPKRNADGSIAVSDCLDNSIDVYDFKNLHDIEDFLILREDGYKNKIYMVPYCHIRESTIGILFKEFLKKPSKFGNELRNYITKIQNIKIDELDLNLILEWDDIKLYSQILEIAENHEDKNIRQLATMCIPKLSGFLNTLYSFLNLKEKNNQYSESEKKLLKKVKQLIYGNDELSQNLKNPNFIRDNTLFLENVYDKNFDENLLNQNLLLRQNSKICAYNPNNPIYIKSSNGEIYDLAHHPERKCDWNTRTTTVQNIYTYIPYLKCCGLSEDKITTIKNMFNKSGQQFNPTPHNYTINMQPLQVGNSFKKVFDELEL